MTIFNTSTRHADGFPSPATDLNSYLTTSINETNFDSNYVTHCFRPTGDGAGIYYNIEHPATTVGWTFGEVAVAEFGVKTEL